MKSLKEILCSLEGLSDIELFVIDLFCGAGGLSEGVEEARLNGNRCAKVVCCVNHDKNAVLSHDANIPDALHFIEDIRTLELSPINTIVERIRELYPDSMIMLHASLECTNFSKAKGGQPRDYYFKLNKKVKALARKSALAYKAQNNAIIVVEDFNFEAPKTKDFVVMTKNLKVSDKKLLVVLPEANKNVYLSARNVKGANVQTISGLNTYRVLDAGVVVFAESALSAIDNILM